MSRAYTRFGFGGACGKLRGVDDEVTGTPPRAGSTARNAAEIRGRIAACFSLAELRRLAEELGVPDIPWDRGMQAAAHELVRRFEQRRELWSLVEQLRAVRPLVEWPDMPTVPPASSIAQAPAHTDIPRPAPLPNLAALPVPSPPTEVATLAPPPIPPTTRTPTVPTPEPAAARPRGAAGQARPAVSPGAAERAPARAARRVDPRLLLAALGLVVASLVVAFLIGRASSAPDGEAAAARAAPASAAPAAPTAARPDGVAARAAAAIERRIESVARACEIPPGAADDVMRRAFERCGPAPAHAAQRTAPAQGSDAPAAEVPAARPDAPGAAPRAAAAANAPAGGNAGCVGACERKHQACRATQCGKEPTQGSQYQRYQSCLSTCLEQASRCRLGCL
ncbi:hypothetical protein WME98_06045 [Sorangium sp. So ce296]|uniref:hypothetical protein n=1 Tax=unclassified Sorangium TaxID=2621164 RepID=UPI003F5BC0B2